MRAKLLIATRNPGKVEEFRLCLAGLNTELVSALELDLGPAPEEVGASYEENALLKAAHAAHGTALPALADDSGLEVEALGGAPGIHSARFGGELGPGERVAHLLQRLRDVPPEERGARFVSVVVLATPAGRVRAFTGECRGRILAGPRGQGGFGYDPVFWSEELGMSFGEASPEQKRAVSHRGRALRNLLDWFADEDSRLDEWLAPRA